MARDIFGVSLPIMSGTEPLSAAVNHPRVMASGGVISVAHGKYWVHDLGQLEAARSRRRTTTLGDLQPGARELKLVGLNSVKGEGLRIVKPRPGADEAALLEVYKHLGITSWPGRDFGGSAELPGSPYSRQRGAGPAGVADALVFYRGGGACLTVGNKYYCSEHLEYYDQEDYDDNNGECPVHRGAKLILEK